MTNTHPMQPPGPEQTFVKKPTLIVMMFRRHLIAAIVMLGTVLLVLLFVADTLNLRHHHNALLSQLRAVESVDSTSSAMGVYSRNGDDLVNYQLLDAQGRWLSLQQGRVKPSKRQQYSHWSRASEVMKKGELAGRGYLPWLPDQVVWAARVMHTPAGEPLVFVAWRRVSAIRAATSFSSYGVVVLGILLAFTVSAVIALQSARYVTGVIERIALSSSRMAAGDFHITLPAQPTAELDKVSQSLMHLACDLDHTTHALGQEHERLQRLEALQRQFVADASHELRAPLTAMRLTLEAWTDNLLRADEQPAALQQLLKETERLSTLVTRLLDLARLESGREVVELAPVDLWQLAQNLVAVGCPPHTACTRQEIPLHFPLVQADEDALYRVLQNLLENARRFTPPHGSICLTAHCADEQAVIQVIDTGSGIDPDELPRIWDRFARAAAARARGKAGSGLGLAIVKGLTEAMGGTVHADSTPDIGTTITLILPLANCAVK